MRVRTGVSIMDTSLMRGIGKGTTMQNDHPSLYMNDARSSVQVTSGGYSNAVASISVGEAMNAADMLSAMADLTVRINSPAFPQVKLDPAHLYCSKTGQRVGMRDSASILQAIAIRGRENFVADAYAAHGTNVHPAWINTTGPLLDEMLDKDPVGYAAFTLGLIVNKYVTKPLRYNREQIAADHWALARAYAIIRQANMSELDLLELNYKCCELLTFGEHAIRLIVKQIGDRAKSPDSLANLAVQNLLQPLMAEAIQKACNSHRDFAYASHRQRFEDAPSSPADAARGPSNIRKQRRSKERVRVAQMAAVFDSFGLHKDFTNDGAARRNAKAQSASIFDTLTPRDMPQGLDILASLDFSKVQAKPEIDETDEYEVEINTISHAEAEMYRAAMHEDERASVQQTVIVSDNEETGTNPLADIIPQPVPDSVGVTGELANLFAAKPVVVEPKPEPVKLDKTMAFFASLKKGG
jgi:hypothetical protein